jgi:hypothetical protein
VLAAWVSTSVHAGCVRIALENYNSESGPCDVVATDVPRTVTKTNSWAMKENTRADHRLVMSGSLMRHGVSFSP